jgi:hypothetical protein
MLDDEAPPVRTRQWWSRVDAFVALAIVLPAIPIITAVARAIAHKWIPLGDQALLEIRARDVLTAHHPLLGTSSSAALNRAGVVPLNHPGPLMFDVLALPVRMFGGGAGLAMGVGAVNLASAAIATSFASRRGGRAGATLAALSFAGLGWAAGSESLYDPYNPTAAMLPCLACLFLAWCAVDLDAMALVWLIGVASFVVQLNNSYLLFLTPLVVAVCSIYVVRSRRRQHTDFRPLALRAGAVFLVLWSQPLIEQLLHGRDGNIARMIRAANVLGDNPGTRLGTQIAAATLTLPPWWGRSEFDGVRLFSPVPDFLLAAASLVVALAACAVGWRWARQHQHGDVVAAMAIAGLSTAISWVAAVRSPMSSFFGVSSDYVRWLWPASVFLWFAIGLAIWRFLAARAPAIAGHRAVVVGAIAVVAVVSLANVPSHVSIRGQRALDQQRATAIDLVDAASDRVDVGTILYRPPPGYDVFGVPLLARLQSNGIDFVVDDPVLVRQFGERRRYDGQPIAELHVATAMDAVDAASDPNTIALVSDVSVGDRIELQATAIAIESWLLDGQITLSDAGRSAVEAGFGDPWLSQLDDPALDATTVSRSISLAAAVQSGLLDADAEVLATLQRYADLRQAVEASTVAVVLVH